MDAGRRGCREVDGAGGDRGPAREVAQLDLGPRTGQADLDGHLGQRGAVVGHVQGGGQAPAGGNDQAGQGQHGEHVLARL